MPTAAITAPADNASILTGTVVNIAATGGDVDGVVVRMDFFVNGVKIGQDNTAPFSFPWTATLGWNTIAVIPWDDQGKDGFQNSIDVLVNRPPTATLTAPTASQQFPTHAVVTLAASAADTDGNLSRVDFYVDGVLVGQDTSAPFTYAWASTVGTHTAQAKAVDFYGSVGSSANVAFTITNVAPTATVTAPTSGQVFATGSVINLTANAADTDGNLARVEFFVDGLKVGQDTVAPFSYAWTSSTGNHTVQAKSFDTMNNVGTSVSVAFSVNNAPTVALTDPVVGKEYLAGAAVPLGATAADSDGTISKVEFLVGGVVIATDTAAPYAASWTGTVGSHQILARAYDNLGRTTTSAARTALVVSRLTQISRQYAYNQYQELCRVTEPETGATLMGYDAAGNLAWSASGLPAGTACDLEGDTAAILARKVVRAYDQRNRITALTFPDQRGDTLYSYTPDGLLESITANNEGTPATTTYQYNVRRLMTREVLSFGPVGWGLDYTYNANGHLTSQIWHGITVDYAPNALGQPTRAGTYATGVSYYPNGALKGFTYGNGIVHSLTQNDRQLPKRSLDLNAGVPVLDDNYVYDKNGSVKSITDGTTGAGNRTMTYDGLDRLKTVTSPMYGTGASYNYDVLDNLTRAKVNTRDYYYCYGANWQLEVARTGPVCEGSASPAAINLDYDPQGNATVRNQATYDFDYGNRLRRAVSSSATTTYAYDGHGLRVFDQTTEAKYSHYNADGLLVMTSDLRADTVNEYIYLAGSLIATRERYAPTGVYTTKYFHTDALDSPVAITDSAGSVIEQKGYEPYGKSTPNDTPGYTGHVEDIATGLTYMQQRYYDPVIALMLSVDPVAPLGNDVRHFNRYAYGFNNPYRFYDPDGRKPQDPEAPDPEQHHEERPPPPTGCGTMRNCVWDGTRWVTFNRNDPSIWGFIKEDGLVVLSRTADVVGGVGQVVIGGAICSGVITCAGGAALGAQGISNIYEGWTGNPSSLRQMYQQVLGKQGGNIAYASVDVLTSGYGLLRPVLKPGSWKLFRYTRDQYVPAARTLTGSQVVTEVGGAASDVKDLYGSAQP